MIESGRRKFVMSFVGVRFECFGGVSVVVGDGGTATAAAIHRQMTDPELINYDK